MRWRGFQKPLSHLGNGSIHSLQRTNRCKQKIYFTPISSAARFCMNGGRALKKLALFLITIMLVSSFAVPAVFAAERNAYEGFQAAQFDETTNPNCSVGAYLGAAGGGQTYTYKNVDFGSNGATRLNIGIAAGEGFGGTVNIYLDNENNDPIATIPVEAAGWGVPVLHSVEIKNLIKGVHTVILVTGGTTADFYEIVFDELSDASNTYNEYETGVYSFSDIADSPYKEAIEAMYQLGMLEVEEGKTLYYPELPVSRGKFVSAAHKLLGNVSVKDGSNIFYDVPEDNPNADDIYTMADLGYIKGYGDGSFRPDDLIYVRDAATVICRMLGYHMYGDSKLLSVAVSNGVLDGIDTGGVLTAAALAQLIENAINADYYEDVGIKNGEFVYNRNTDGILSVTSRIYHGRGVVSATPFTGLTSPDSSLGSTEVIIDGEKFYVGSTEAISLLGYECDYYFYDNGDEKTLLSAIPIKVNVTDISTRDTDIASITTSKVEYYNENGKKVTLKLSDGVHIIYNGKAIDDKLEALISDDFRGRIRYIENSGAENVLIIDEYINISIGSQNKKDKTIYDEFGKKKYIFHEDEYTTFFSRDGKFADYGNLKAGEGAMLFISKNTSGEKLVRLWVATGSAIGEITAKSDDKIYIDGVPYPVAREYTEDIVIGSGVEAIINDYGEIVDMKEATDTTDKIAWLIDSGAEGANTMSAKKKIKVLDTDNVINIYYLSDNCFVDGRKMTASFAFDDSMNDNPVRYKLRNGKVTMLDTIVKDTEDTEKDTLIKIDGLTFDDTGALYSKYLESVYWKAGSRQFYHTDLKGNIINLSEGAPLLIKNEGETGEDSYAWGDTSVFSDSNKIEAYSFDFSFGMADVVVYERKASGVTSKGSCVFDKIIQVTDENGDSCSQLVGKTASGEVTYLMKGNYPEAEAQIRALSKGDWIEVKSDSKGEVKSLTVLYLKGGAENLSYNYNAQDKTVPASLSATKDESYGGRNAGIYERYIYARVLNRRGSYLEVEHIVNHSKEYVHMGGEKAIRLSKISPNKTIVENNINIDTLVAEDYVLLEYINGSLRCAYIVNE